MIAKNLTVSELIELLKQAPSDAFVETEGCDCNGEAAGIEISKDKRVVVIRRIEYVYEAITYEK